MKRRSFLAWGMGIPLVSCSIQAAEEVSLKKRYVEEYQSGLKKLWDSEDSPSDREIAAVWNLRQKALNAGARATSPVNYKGQTS